MDKIGLQPLKTRYAKFRDLKNGDRVRLVRQSDEWNEYAKRDIVEGTCGVFRTRCIHWDCCEWKTCEQGNMEIIRI